MEFTKMQGIGNDYVYVDCFKEKVEHPGEVSKYVSDRHFGIGSDGLILICPSDKADCRMDICRCQRLYRLAGADCRYGRSRTDFQTSGKDRN